VNALAAPGWRGYTLADQFHEPFTVLAYAAALTRTIRLVTAVIVLPQRQTVLAAKQAAEIDVLSGGRLTLGVGVGWNQVEYEALNEDFHTRGRKLDEQLALMRELWTKDAVTFKGRFHTVTEAGLTILPKQRPIPIWMGGTSEAMLERIVKSAQGWFPLFPPDDAGKARVDQLRAIAAKHHRDVTTIGIDAHISLRDSDEDGWRKAADAWKSARATSFMLNTMSFNRARMTETAGLFKAVQQHLDALRRAKSVVDIL
jgi:probable F420-dependent oxidoreductase